MKPGDHPDFFRFPAPEGRSRESTIVLDARGRFFHDGEPVLKEAMSRAFFQWIRTHPDDGRFILENGYDWTYFTVEDVPFFIESVRLHPGPEHPTEIRLTLSDATEEILDLSTVQVAETDKLYCRVKGGTFEAAFSQGAQLALLPVLEQSGPGDFQLRVDGKLHPITSRPLPPFP